MFLFSLGGSQTLLYESLSNLGDLEHAISKLRQAVQLTELRYPDNRLYLCNLGLSQKHRCERLNEPKDIELSISTLQQAV
jgi:hypothetical protein